MALSPVSRALCVAAALLASSAIRTGAAPLGAGPGPIPAVSPDPFPIRPVADTVRGRRDPCLGRGDCPGRRPPGDPDRDVRPFEGSLGRPCAYRPLFTPSGTRRVRVCY